MTTGQRQKGWDVDLPLGEYGENKLVNILQGEKLEVKYDMMAAETGNIYVEYNSRGKDSGITTTEATHWAFVIEGIETVVIIETKRLKVLCRKYWNRRFKGGDNDSSLGILIPLSEIFDK